MPYKDLQSIEAKRSSHNRSKKYYSGNREMILKKNKTDPRRLKSSRINNWKRRGVVGDLNELYDKYLNTDKCEICEKTFISSRDKCLDHDHDTNLFRYFLCKDCNNFDRWKKKENVIQAI
tara:strand:- start:380 stop:739 length:360 start_codon:yes stop_codon:yes gene_type:complete